MKRLFISAIALVAVLAYPAAFAQVKISELPAAGALAGTEPVPVVQGGATVRTTASAIAALAGGTTLASGTWTPTCTLGSNAEACTGVAGIYLRVGSVVSWSARFNADSTGSSTFAVSISLPVASNFSNTTQAIGTCTSPTTSISAGGAQSDGTADNIAINLNASQTTSQTYYCSGTYSVI
jgi:hypothetical protein